MSILLSWSGGKDGMRVLWENENGNGNEVSSLFTTFSEEFRRVTMHGVREELLDIQAEALGLPVKKLFLPSQPDMTVYNREMYNVYTQAQLEGITTVAFGDIFLEDLRNYRERQVEKAGLKAIFPIWGSNSLDLVYSFIDLGFKAIVTTVDGSKLSREFVGRIINRQFIADLPGHVDPCGENGEFHTFVTDGPLFERPVPYVPGEIVERNYPSPVHAKELITYYFLDLLPS
jgi:uncharacterized protein (TIGR00290 family)